MKKDELKKRRHDLIMRIDSISSAGTFCSTKEKARKLNEQYNQAWKEYDDYVVKNASLFAKKELAIKILNIAVWQDQEWVDYQSWYQQVKKLCYEVLDK